MIAPPNCWKRNCIHYLGILQPDGTEFSERPICKAYPNQIPNDIAYGKDLHLTVRGDQDNQIVFKKEE